MAAQPAQKPHFAEFVPLIASLMALGALGIDIMLPALPVIGRQLHVADANNLQWIVSVYFLGFGVGQLIFGVLSDWLGRKAIMVGGVFLYVIFGLIAAFTDNFTFLLVLRLLQGIAASTTSVVARSIIRDLYSGPQMAKVTSISLVVFLLVPILAPSIGQLILLAGPWQAIFFAMAAFGTFAGLWAFFRLPETLPPEKRQRPDLNHLKRVSLFIIIQPTSLFYTLAITVMIGSLLTYVSLMPQIFQDVFQKPALMAPVFAACAATMGAASIVNATLVERVGLLRMSHSALIGFITLSATHLIWCLSGLETIASFMIFQGLTMGAMSLTTSNFTAIAMEKVGHVAGTASSLQGVVTTVGAAILAGLIGRGWHGHVYLLPLAATVCGLIAMGFVLLSAKGRLFKA
ncbi:MAG: multidrug effflux MFS transporter [Asticcacaulis sp.]